jgi:hypothetical protein
MKNDEIEALRNVRKDVAEMQAEAKALQAQAGALIAKFDVLSNRILRIYRGDFKDEDLTGSFD